MIIKVNYKKVLLWFLVFLWMTVIFSFSSAPAEVSQGTSGGITEKIARLVVKDYHSLTAEKKEAVLSRLSFFIRKSAHFTEYFILGALFYLAFRLQKMKERKKVLLSLSFSLLYAISDEVHQAFVPGRACRFTDVLIDLCGITAGVCLLFFVTKKLFHTEI